MQKTKKIVLASNNQGKLAEFAELFAGFPIQLIPQNIFGLVDSVPETGTTFIENAIIKARHAAAITNLPAIADDSGIEVAELHGEPGVRSSCYSGQEGDFARHIDKLLQAMASVPQALRQARFHCTLVYLRSACDPSPLIAEALWEGYVLDEPRGHQGFGYDPIFYVPQFDCSAAELSREQKNLLSHRGQAMRNLWELLKKEL